VGFGWAGAAEENERWRAACERRSGASRRRRETRILGIGIRFAGEELVVVMLNSELPAGIAN
jgi:hypothetical protein